MTRLTITLTCFSLFSLALVATAEARVPTARFLQKYGNIKIMKKKGFTGHSVRAKVFTAFKRQNLAAGRTRRISVSAVGLTRTGKSRVFAVTNRQTGEVRLALQSVKTMRLRLFKRVIRPAKKPVVQPKKPVVQPKTTVTNRGSGGGTRYNAETYSRALTGGLISSSYSSSGRGGYKSIP